MIAVVTDSNAMLPASTTERFNIRVVPLTIVIDGQPSAEDRELDLPAFFARLRAGATITTSAPSPGEILDRYRGAVDAGAHEILSIHVGASYSATVDSARLAASMIGIPVHVVDTAQASFAHGCCVYAAAEALAGGASALDAAAVATATGAAIGSVFTIPEVLRAQAGGRLQVRPAAGIPVVALTGTELSEVARVGSSDQAIATMTHFIADLGPGLLRVGVGDADDAPTGDALAAAVGQLANVAEVIRYRMGPSVAAHTGAGSFGALFHPLG